MPCFLHSPLPQDLARVGFGRGSSTLDPQAKAVLDRQAEILRGYPDLPMTVWGHVDHEEAKLPGGQALGYQRAAAVRDHLVARGVAPERISTDSRGNRWAIPMEPLSESALASMRFDSTETHDNR
ncbi:MAG: OmpA family protein [Pseudomonadota bacterium]